MPALILASASPRRAELLGRLGVPFTVAPTDVDETPRAGEAPGPLVRRLAEEKAGAALAVTADPDAVVLAADTIVVLDRVILGKPADGRAAASALRTLSGRTHLVLTGVAVASRAGGVAVDLESTEVTLDDLSDEDIAWYVATGEPLDKAGAYGIQGRGGLFVRSIRGSWDNVVGLPLARTRHLLAAAGIGLGGATGDQPPLV